MGRTSDELRERATSSRPSASSTAWQTVDPMRPAAPVTATRIVMALAYPGGATGHDEGAAPGLGVWLCRIGRVLAVTAGSLLLIVQLQVTDRRGDPVDCAYADCWPAVRLLLPPALVRA